MGKDMQNHLQWLEDALLEEEREAGQEELEFDLDALLEEFGQEEEAPKPARNRAREFDRMAFGDEEFDEAAAVTVAAKKSRKSKGNKKEGKKGVGGLAIVAVLEVVAIVLVLLRWALWFL